MPNQFKCDNCSSEFDSTKGGLVTTSHGHLACAICDTCMTGARLIKLVLRRGNLGDFFYEQYSAIEMVKSPRTAKAVG